MARLEKELEEGTSRTGEPLIPPAVFRWVALGYGILVAVLGTLLAYFPDVKGLQVGTALIVALAPVLGIASPGIRRAAMLALLVLSPTMLTGCATFQRVGTTVELAAPKVLDCGVDAAVAALPEVLAEVGTQLGKVLDKGSFDVEPVIDELLEKGKSPFLPCAIAAVFQAWMQAGSGAGVDLPSDPDRARRMLLAAHLGQAHLLARGFVCR